MAKNNTLHYILKTNRRLEDSDMFRILNFLGAEAMGEIGKVEGGHQWNVRWDYGLERDNKLDSKDFLYLKEGFNLDCFIDPTLVRTRSKVFEDWGPRGKNPFLKGGSPPHPSKKY